MFCVHELIPQTEIMPREREKQMTKGNGKGRWIKEGKNRERKKEKKGKRD